MGFLKAIFSQDKFTRYVMKLYNHYEFNTKLVKEGAIVSPKQLDGIIIGLCYILEINPKYISDYSLVENLGKLYITVETRYVSSIAFGFTGAIDRTPQVLLERYKDLIPSEKVAREVSYFLYECVQNKTEDLNYYLEICKHAKNDLF